MTALVLIAQASDVAARVGQGRIVGGWGYIWFAYGLTWSVLLLYGLSLFLRKRRRARES